jgi:CRISPR-associated protein Cas2
MVIMILEKVPVSVRGELTRWLVEVRTGVFVGHVSALVREKLWSRCLQVRGLGSVIQAWSTNTEQHFQMRTSGDASRQVVDFEGIQLIRIPTEKKTLQ